jgi:hypothetical protein
VRSRDILFTRVLGNCVANWENMTGFLRIFRIN